MIPETFKALRAEEMPGSGIQPVIRTLPLSSLPSDEVLIQVHYSSLNYKDALSATGNRGVTRSFPHTPGIDACGTVVYSADQQFSKGDKVLVHGYDLGMNTPGGFGQYIQVPAAWVMPLPEGLSFAESMMLGTAGFTAALALQRMEVNGQKPSSGPVLVTGAGGGLGSLAVNILASLGYEVIASTGKPESADFLRSLGAAQVIGRIETGNHEKLLLKPRWSGVIDTIGGEYLGTAIKACNPHGNVAVCGNAASHLLNTSVYPFILNGINLLGIESATWPMPERRKIWEKLAGDWKPPMLKHIAALITLHQLPEHIHLILNGKIKGRVFVDLKD